VLFALMAVRFGLAWDLPAYLYLAAIAVALALIDIDVRRLPNAIVLPSYPVVAALLLVSAIVEGRWDDYLRAAVGCVILFAFYFLLAFIYPAGMGFGDVKLAGVLGAYLGWLGWAAFGAGAFLGFLLGGVLGALLMAVGRAGRKSKIPFGPFMLAGALIAVFVGDTLVDLYTGLFGL
jgi:leader peptidase (prepilin peptidase)/N-methyltransferase